LPAYALWKRCADIVSALLLMALMSPVIVVVLIWVRMDSPGPVIFRQQRVGRFGKPFTIYKFRTMTVSAPNLPTDQVVRAGVNYVTRSGRFLRRASLDELPQLWNVLKGDMSVIGPRPALPSQVAVNSGREAARVHDLLPGITGWAQVNGRDDLSDEEKVQMDKYYRDNLSLALDISILARTGAALSSGRGAN
jgi:O-antigen biosynthesis protein WbqP